MKQLNVSNKSQTERRFSVSAPQRLLQRQCACGQRVSGGGTRTTCQQKEPTSYSKSIRNVPPIVEAVLNSDGQPMDAATRNFMESRFAHDFTGVRVHTDTKAAEAARAVNALAYTVGQNVVFGAGQYKPGTTRGNYLLGHELTHTIQQARNPKTSKITNYSDTFAENEAETNATQLTQNFGTIAVKHNTEPRLARFSDTVHHVIDEAALSGAGFTPQQIRQTERGNAQRDFSQDIGVVLNTLLVCQPNTFGGYAAEEHFDNFMWDAVRQGWRSRGASPLSPSGAPVAVGTTPLDYISRQLNELVRLGLNEKGLVHLGNAFHTVEDLFSHSNFIELINGDYRFGRTLVTGNFDDADKIVSTSHVIAGVSSSPTKEYYEQQGENALARTKRLSHSRMTHDHPSSHNYAQARRLAALVTQELGRDILTVMQSPPAQQLQLMNQLVMAKITRYLRPPSEDDRWWETLSTQDAGKIDQRLQEAEERTPLTVNHCMFSPLRNLEASRDSNLRIPLGVAVPVMLGGNRIFLQLGAGVHTELPLEPLPPGFNEPKRGESGLFVGGQITGRF